MLPPIGDSTGFIFSELNPYSFLTHPVIQDISCHSRHILSFNCHLLFISQKMNPLLPPKEDCTGFVFLKINYCRMKQEWLNDNGMRDSFYQVFCLTFWSPSSLVHPCHFEPFLDDFFVIWWSFKYRMGSEWMRCCWNDHFLTLWWCWMTGVRVEWCNFWSKAYALDLNHPHSVLIYFISNISCSSIVKKLFWRGLSRVERYLSKNKSSAASYRRQQWIHFFWVKSSVIPDTSCHSRHILSFYCHTTV